MTSLAARRAFRAFGTLLLACVILTRTTAAQPAPPLEVRVTDYGALCNGRTDDSRAFGAAIHAALGLGARAGTIVLPAGTCAITSTIVLGDDTGGTSTTYLSMRGGGMNASEILWRGPANGTAIKLVRNDYFRLQDFRVQNGLGAAGAAEGIVFTGYGGIGTETFGGIVDHIFVDGFGTGMHVGASDVHASASDILFNYIEIDDCTTGWKNEEQNSLNLVFQDANFVGDTIGLQLLAGNASVRGGSTANNTIDYDAVGGQFLSLSDIRSENEGTHNFLVVEGTIAVSVERSFQAGGATQPIVLKNGYDVTVDRSQFRNIIFGVPSGFGTFQHVSITSSSSCGDGHFPFHDTGNVSTQITLRDNGCGQTRLPDYQGFLFGQSIFATARMETEVRPDTSDGRPEYWLQAVRLSEGGQPASQGEILGHNLRVQIKFAGRPTADVRFTHTVTVSRNGSVGSVSAGVVAQSDLGRKATFVERGTTTYGYISSVDVGAQQIKWTSNGDIVFANCGPCAGVNVAIGEDEPDANYMLALACDRQETFSWSSKTRSGFTLTSSNRASMATCDVMVVR